MIQSSLRILWLLLGWVELVVFAVPLWLMSFLPPHLHGRWYKRWFHRWTHVWTHALGADLRVHHKNAHPLPETFIMIANHPSSFEDAGIPALFDVDSLAKHEVRDWFVVGRISAAAGTIFVKRDSPASRAAASRKIREHLAAGRSVALYPEGGINGPRLQPKFHFGAFDISLDTNTPIVPVYLHYEAIHDFHWGSFSLLRNLLNIMSASNNRANYYVFDAVDPKLFRDRVSYRDHLYGLYQQWQTRYMD